jgi:uncharacterized protein YndB with AHSA1/START domain
METISFTTLINAAVQKVWDTMLNKNTYPQWTKAFAEGSTFEGSWDQGSEIRFVGINAEGKQEGMYSRIRENRKYQFISIEHVGIIADGKVDTTSDKVKKWAPSFENYTFRVKGNATELQVDMQVEKEYKKMFEEMWPKALKLLKELCEN